VAAGTAGCATIPFYSSRLGGRPIGRTPDSELCNPPVFQCVFLHLRWSTWVEIGRYLVSSVAISVAIRRRNQRPETASAALKRAGRILESVFSQCPKLVSEITVPF
jgi:hypothetical protein